MRWHRGAVVAAGLNLAIVSSSIAQAAPPADCWAPEEVAAVRVRNLQSMLLVESLKCRDTVPDTVVAYNDFVTKKRELLLADKYRVQDHFIKNFGAAAGSVASNNYETRAGNHNSSSGISPERCRSVAAYARLAANASDQDLPAFAGAVARSNPIADCPVAPAAMVIPVWKNGRPLPVAAPDPVMQEGVVETEAPIDDAVATIPMTEPVATRKAAALPAVVQAAPAEPEKPMAVAAVSKTPAPADAATALQAAAAALAQAAAALQAPAQPGTH